MAFKFSFKSHERRHETVSNDDFEKEYQKFIEEQKKLKQERKAAKVAEQKTKEISTDTDAAVDAIIEATDKAEVEEKPVKKKKKKAAIEEDTVELKLCKK